MFFSVTIAFGFTINDNPGFRHTIDPAAKTEAKVAKKHGQESLSLWEKLTITNVDQSSDSKL